MIEYRNDAWLICLICRLRGSVLPKALLYATTNCILAIVLHWGVRQYADLAHADVDGDGVADFLQQMEGAPVMWSGYTSVLGVLVVFRNNQAYSRFWEGATLVRQLRGEWFNSVSALLAFCSKDPRKQHKVHEFQQLLVRLTSVMFCSALQQVCELDEEALEVLDLSDVSVDHLKFLEEVPDRAHVIIGWIQRLIVSSHNEGTLDVPAPILSRSFQELSRGAVNLNNLRKIKDIPFPYPYQQMMICMLFVHYLMTPVLASFFVENIFWASALCFFVTGGFWSILYIAAEIDQPFGDDPNDLPLVEMQKEFNSGLLMLLLPVAQTVPTLTSKTKRKKLCHFATRTKSLVSCWSDAHKTKGMNSEESQSLSQRARRKSLVSFMADAHKSGSFSSEEPQDSEQPVDQKPKTKKRTDPSAFDTGSTVDTELSRDEDAVQQKQSLSIPMAFKLASVFRKIQGETRQRSECSISELSSSRHSEVSDVESEDDAESIASQPVSKDSPQGCENESDTSTDTGALGLNAVQIGHQTELRTPASLDRHEHVRV